MAGSTMHWSRALHHIMMQQCCTIVLPVYVYVWMPAWFYWQRGRFGQWPGLWFPICMYILWSHIRNSFFLNEAFQGYRAQLIVGMKVIYWTSSFFFVMNHVGLEFLCFVFYYLLITCIRMSKKCSFIFYLAFHSNISYLVIFNQHQNLTT